MTAKLSRKEMKRDEVRESMDSAFHYLQTHTRQLAIGLLVVVVAALLIAGLYSWRKSRSAAANDLLARAITAMNAGIDVEAPSPDDPENPTYADATARDAAAQVLLEEVREKHGSTKPGKIAGVYLGRIAARNGDYAAARDKWEAFLATSPKDMLATEVQLNLFELDRIEGRGDEVVQRLREMIAGTQGSLPIDAGLNQLAHTLESLDRSNEARDVYQRLVDEYSSSPYAARARQQIQTLDG